MMNPLDIAESIAERIDATDAAALPTSFGGGAAGIALFLFALAQARSPERWAASAHRWLKKAATHGEAAAPGLFTGLAGLLFVSAYAARFDERYSRLRDQCAERLIASGAAAPPLVNARRARDYDLVAGVAGVHAALLYAGQGPQASGTRAYLHWLVDDPMRWACPHELHAEQGVQRDAGVAHGFAGLLSVLAADDRTPRDLLERAADELWQMRIAGTDLWPSSVGPSLPEPARVAWCYGNPGIVMALLRAAERTDSAIIADRARDALRAVIALPRESWGQIDDGLCHGRAGNALMLTIASRYLDDANASAAAGNLMDELTSGYDASHPFGYRIWDNLNHCWSDDPSLMTGSAGIALALVTLSSKADDSWTSAFALPPMMKTVTGATR